MSSLSDNLKGSTTTTTSPGPPESIFETNIEIGAAELNDDLGVPEIKGFADGPENIWSAGQNALRDLLLYLIQKHELDEVGNPKIR